MAEDIVGWNLNYNGSDNNTTTDRASQEMEFIKEPIEFTKEFIKEPIEVGEKWENGKLSMKNTRDSLIEYEGVHPCMGINLTCW